MSEVKEHFRESKSSNDGSFEALNELQEQHRSRPSQSNDFQPIKQSADQNPIENQQEIIEQIKKKPKITIQESLRKQNHQLLLEIKQKQMKILALDKQLIEYKRKTVELQEKVIEYETQKQVYQKKEERIFPGQIQEYSQRVSLLELQNNSLMLKLQVYEEEDKKIRKWMQSYLKISHFSQKMTLSLSTLVQSAIIQFQSNLQEIAREIDSVIVNFKLNGSRKTNKPKQKYNHWEVLDQIQTIKGVLEQKMTST